MIQEFCQQPKHPGPCKGAAPAAQQLARMPKKQAVRLRRDLVKKEFAPPAKPAAKPAPKPKAPRFSVAHLTDKHARRAAELANSFANAKPGPEEKELRGQIAAHVGAMEHLPIARLNRIAQSLGHRGTLAKKDDALKAIHAQVARRSGKARLMSEPRKFAEDHAVASKPLSIKAVQIFEVGEHPTADGPKNYTSEDLRRIVQNFTKLSTGDGKKFSVPVVLGHEEKDDPKKVWINWEQLSTGEPAVGWVTRVWLEDNDTKLMADFEDVLPEVAQMIQKGMYKAVSSEIYDDFEDQGQNYGVALRRVACLGGEIPQVKGMEPLPLPKPAEAFSERRKHGPRLKTTWVCYRGVCRPCTKLSEPKAKGRVVYKMKKFGDVADAFQNFPTFGGASAPTPAPYTSSGGSDYSMASSSTPAPTDPNGSGGAGPSFAEDLPGIRQDAAKRVGDAQQSHAHLAGQHKKALQFLRENRSKIPQEKYVPLLKHHAKQYGHHSSRAKEMGGYLNEFAEISKFGWHPIQSAKHHLAAINEKGQKLYGKAAQLRLQHGSKIRNVARAVAGGIVGGSLAGPPGAIGGAIAGLTAGAAAKQVGRAAAAIHERANKPKPLAPRPNLPQHGQEDLGPTPSRGKMLASLEEVRDLHNAQKSILEGLGLKDTLPGNNAHRHVGEAFDNTGRQIPPVTIEHITAALQKKLKEKHGDITGQANKTKKDINDQITQGDIGREEADAAKENLEKVAEKRKAEASRLFAVHQQKLEAIDKEMGQHKADYLKHKENYENEAKALDQWKNEKETKDETDKAAAEARAQKRAQIGKWLGRAGKVADAGLGIAALGPAGLLPAAKTAAAAVAPYAIGGAVAAALAKRKGGGQPASPTEPETPAVKPEPPKKQPEPAAAASPPPQQKPEHKEPSAPPPPPHRSPAPAAKPTTMPMPQAAAPSPPPPQQPQPQQKLTLPPVPSGNGAAQAAAPSTPAPAQQPPKASSAHVGASEDDLFDAMRHHLETASHKARKAKFLAKTEGKGHPKTQAASDASEEHFSKADDIVRQLQAKGIPEDVIKEKYRDFTGGPKTPTPSEPSHGDLQEELAHLTEHHDRLELNLDLAALGLLEPGEDLVNAWQEQLKNAKARINQVQDKLTNKHSEHRPAIREHLLSALTKLRKFREMRNGKIRKHCEGKCRSGQKMCGACAAKMSDRGKPPTIANQIKNAAVCRSQGKPAGMSALGIGTCGDHKPGEKMAEGMPAEPKPPRFGRIKSAVAGLGRAAVAKIPAHMNPGTVGLKLAAPSLAAHAVKAVGRMFGAPSYSEEPEKPKFRFRLASPTDKPEPPKTKKHVLVPTHIVNTGGPWGANVIQSSRYELK